MTPAPSTQLFLRATLSWGDWVVATTNLELGQSIRPNEPGWAVPVGAVPAGAVPAGVVPVGAVPAGVVPVGAVPAGVVPDAVDGAATDDAAPEVPVGAVPVPDAAGPDAVPEGLGPFVRGQRGGWEVNASGVSEGEVRLDGVERSITEGERVLLKCAGDAAVLGYGAFWVRCSVEARPPLPPRSPALDPQTLLAAAFAVVVVLGGLGLVYALTAAPSAAKPVQLQPADELARLYYLDASSLATPALTGHGTEAARSSSERPPFPRSSVEASLRRLPYLKRDGSLTPLEVNEVVLANYRSLEACAERRDAIAHRGDIHVKLVVGPNGAVQDVKLLDGLGDGAAQCVGDQLRRFEFPSASSSTEAEFALHLPP